MKNIYSVIVRFAIAITGFSLVSTQANAITYTAVVSGSFSNTLTWGGILPSTLVTGDVIIIPNGVTVTMDNTVTMSGSSTLIVNGTLNSSSTPTALVMAGGTLSGTGSIAVDSIAIGMGSAFTFTGNITADAVAVVNANVSSSANITINGALHVSNGTLDITNGIMLMTNNSTVVINGGALSVSGTGSISWCGDYDVVYQGASVVSGVELTGIGLQNVTLDVPGGFVTLDNNVTLDGMLTFNAGNLVLNGHDLYLDVNSNIQTTGSGYIVSTTGSNISINCNYGLIGSLNFGTGSGVVNNLTINLGDLNGMVSLGSDLIVNGTLNLNAGSLRLAGNDLTFAANSDIAVGGAGTITANTASDISIMANNSFSGELRFSAFGNGVNNFIVNMPNASSTVTLGSELSVNGSLVLGSGLVDLNGNELSIEVSGAVSGGSVNSYVIADNGGILTQNMSAGITKTFHVGTSVNYIPAVIEGNAGCGSGELSVNVAGNVFAQGYSGSDISVSNPVVDATWYMTGNVMGSLDLDVELMWDAGMEVNGFDNTQAYISLNNGMNWDVSASSAATMNNGMHSMKRSNVTTLSPMMITDNSSTLTVAPVVAAADEVTIYPNPAVDVLHFTTPKEVNAIDIYDVAGRKVQSVKGIGNSVDVSGLTPGYYSIQLSGDNYMATKPFIKGN